MADRSINIDSEKFAYHLMDSVPNAGETMEELGKKKLMAYLTGYYLIENFNQLEQEIIDEAVTDGDVDLKTLTYGELMDRISKRTFF